MKRLKELIAKLPDTEKAEAEAILASLESTDAGQKGEKVDFQKLFDNAFAKGFAKASNQQKEGLTDAEKTELEELRKKAKEFEKKDNKDGKEYITQEDLQKLIAENDTKWKSELTAKEEKLNSLLVEKKKSSVISAAAKLNAINPEIVSKLLIDSISIDESGGLFVANEKGNPLIGSDGKELGVEKYVESYLTENSYLVKPTGNTGAGSGTNQSNNTTGKVGLQQLEDFKTFKQLKEAGKL